MRAMLLWAVVCVVCAGAARGAVSVSVDASTQYQTIRGYGASAWAPEYVTQEMRNDLAREAVNELGLNRLRMEGLPAGNTSDTKRWNWLNDDGDPEHINWAAFNTADFDAALAKFVLPFKQHVEARGEVFDSEFPESISASVAWNYITATQTDDIWQYVGLVSYHLYGDNSTRSNIRDFAWSGGSSTGQTEYMGLTTTHLYDDQDGNGTSDGDDWDGDGTVNMTDATPGAPSSAAGGAVFSCASGLCDARAPLVMLMFAEVLVLIFRRRLMCRA